MSSIECIVILEFINCSRWYCRRSSFRFRREIFSWSSNFNCFVCLNKSKPHFRTFSNVPRDILPKSSLSSPLGLISQMDDLFFSLSFCCFHDIMLICMCLIFYKVNWGLGRFLCSLYITGLEIHRILLAMNPP